MGAHPHRQTAASRSRGRLTATLALTCAFLVVEVAGALWSGSLALLADAGHMLTDAGGLGLALFAIWVAARPPTPAKTYGYYRAEILAALVNAIVLLVVAGGILVETYRRLLAPPEILGGPMLVVALLGLAVNLVCARLLHHAAGQSLNVRAAYFEVLGDALSSAGVVIAALVVVGTGWRKPWRHTRSPTRRCCSARKTTSRSRRPSWRPGPCSRTGPLGSRSVRTSGLATRSRARRCGRERRSVGTARSSVSRRRTSRSGTTSTRRISGSASCSGSTRSAWT